MVIRALLDVGVLVLAIEKNNPVRAKYLDILTKSIRGDIISYIPFNVILGAYHVLTKVFKVNGRGVRNKLFALMRCKKIKWITSISFDEVKRAIEYATIYNFESWDGFILTIMRDFDIPIIYTIDEDFLKVKDIEVRGLLNPKEKDALNNYIESLKKKSAKT